MNQAVINEVAKLNVESALDFLASKYDTTAQLIADCIALGQEKLVAEFLKLIEVGLNETFKFIA